MRYIVIAFSILTVAGVAFGQKPKDSVLVVSFINVLSIDSVNAKDILDYLVGIPTATDV